MSLESFSTYDITMTRIKPRKIVTNSKLETVRDIKGIFSRKSKCDVIKHELLVQLNHIDTFVYIFFIQSLFDFWDMYIYWQFIYSTCNLDIHWREFGSLKHLDLTNWLKYNDLKKNYFLHRTKLLLKMISVSLPLALWDYVSLSKWTGNFKIT